MASASAGPARAWRRVVSVGLTCVGLAFVIALAYHNREQVLAWLQQARVGMAACALLALLLSTVGAGIVFRSLVQGSDGRQATPPPGVLPVFLLSQIAKYIPGRVWIVLMQHTAFEGRVAARDVVAANLEIAVMALATTLGAAALFWTGAEYGSAWMVPLAALLVVGVRAILQLRITGWLLALLGNLVPGFSREGVAAPRRAGRGATLGVALFVAGYCAGWVALIHAGGVDLATALRITALLSLSYIVGMLSFLPAGLGAREAALLALGAWISPQPAMMASVAVVTRLAMVAVDAAAALLASTWLLYRSSQR